MTDTVIICETCRTPSGDAQGLGFAKALRAALDAQGRRDIAVETVACLNICDEPVSLALRGDGKETYLFAGVDPSADLDDAVALAGLFAEADSGVITDARAAGRLRFCLRGRVPQRGTPVTS
ncbi:DUF1636 family protein [Shimia biformata]|uniref:DUF1636 family protein n=1 Tax=Shimia biformata TaxID=1294299 RepID=UPI0019507891|nr:DUF1636 family protein [Shimia biformata]